MAVVTNKELLLLAKSDTTFEKQTSKFSKELFETNGYKAYSAMDNTLKGDFWNLLVQVYMGKIRGNNARIPSNFNLVVEQMSNPNGGQQRRIRAKVVKPTDPKYRNLVNNGSVDPFVIRQLQLEEEYYKQNFDYSNNLTITDTDAKKMFNDPSGFAQTIDTIMTNFEDAKNIQEYEIIREMVSKILNDTTLALQASQKIEVPEIVTSGNSPSSNATCASFIQVFKNLVDLFRNTTYSQEFNAKKFMHGCYEDRYVLFVRAEILNYINTTLMTTAFHTENLGIPFKVVGVKDFGGIKYVKPVSGGTDTEMKPVYSTQAGNKGEMLGYNASGDEDDPLEDIADLKVVDPNATTDAVLLEKGVMFKTEQDPYTVGAIYNPAGRYTNYWAGQPNQGINYDGSYDVIKFYHSTSSNKANKVETDKKETK